MVKNFPEERIPCVNTEVIGAPPPKQYEHHAASGDEFPRPGFEEQGEVLSELLQIGFRDLYGAPLRYVYAFLIYRQTILIKNTLRNLQIKLINIIDVHMYMYMYIAG